MASLQTLRESQLLPRLLSFLLGLCPHLPPWFNTCVPFPCQTHLVALCQVGKILSFPTDILHCPPSWTLDAHHLLSLGLTSSLLTFLHHGHPPAWPHEMMDWSLPYLSFLWYLSLYLVHRPLWSAGKPPPLTCHLDQGVQSSSTLTLTCTGLDVILISVL
jgi:hypothetical protein